MYIHPKNRIDSSTPRGIFGLPEDYPIPADIDNMLFFIQRNQNTNTVVYTVNHAPNGLINLNEPINVFWKQYNNHGETKDLNYIQRKLAYGYEFDVINPVAIQMNIVAYPDFKIYVTKNDDNKFRAVAKLNGEWAEISNVYVYADENGAFPMVKYIELYGINIDSKLPEFQKIEIQK